MKIKNVDYIVTARHYGDGSARGYIRKMQGEIHKRGIDLQIKGMDRKPEGTPVIARIWQGQWIADCECRSASFVDPDDPIFFCFGCGNRINGNQLRPVIFPQKEERVEIERLLLERPVDDRAGLTDLERAGMAKAVVFLKINIKDGDQEREELLPLVRSWEPGETAKDLQVQQDDAIRNWKKELKGGRNGI